MRVISRIRDDFQVEISLSDLFETPTVVALAGYIETSRPPRDGAEAFLYSQLQGTDNSCPLFAQQRLWFWTSWSQEAPLTTFFRY